MGASHDGGRVLNIERIPRKYTDLDSEYTDLDSAITPEYTDLDSLGNFNQKINSMAILNMGITVILLYLFGLFLEWILPRIDLTSAGWVILLEWVAHRFRWIPEFLAWRKELRGDLLIKFYYVDLGLMLTLEVCI